MEASIAVIKGDGIGPEIVDEAVKVLKAVEKKYGHEFHFEALLAGGAAIDQVGECLPEVTVEKAKKSDAVLLGAVGGPKWDTLEGSKRPEKALLGLRKSLNLYCNMRPAVIYDALLSASPLKDSITKGGIDVLVIRELTGGIYFGEKKRQGESAYDVMSYSKDEIRRISIKAFEAARKRKKKVTSVDKANVLETSRLWRETVNEVASSYPDVTLNHLYVDNASMQLVINPSQFDVILTENMFGDILSDEASMITGSIGLLPSASLSDGKKGMYEPIHGSAPDIAGMNIANPLATILSAAMMLRYSLNLDKEAEDVDKAVKAVLDKGFRTKDIAKEGESWISTSEMGSLVEGEIL
ncbi:MAG TPA: 3-isopropylmalate dehydrogenase [Candidatus Ornithospirochaeta avicola]|uniref:3-isopropylmalate dehydrogenase n=1 Tax=Candidatus Ornithospirochaeta avicola TaxID=2840896 RepID=A0A9D1TN95_9SPIO|nr:3-isopropylmalate dehydrogenase [Candidatus Ornithospirochaeta avicola]